MRTVLIVEDDPVVTDLLETVLTTMSDVQTCTASCVAEARARLASDESIALVITDIQLPGEDGLSLAEAIHSMPGRRELPVIVSSSRGDAEARRRAQAAGARAYLRKPWSPAALRETVNSILNEI